MKLITKTISGVLASLLFCVAAPLVAEAAENASADDVVLVVAASETDSVSANQGSVEVANTETNKDSDSSDSDSSTVEGSENNGESGEKAETATPANPTPEQPKEPEKPVIKSTFEKVDGVWIYYDANGKGSTMVKLAPGWVKQENVWYWFPNNNSFVRSNWATVGSARYHFDALGHMQTGWFNADGKRYYAASSGAMKTGWLSQNNRWYYLDSSGPMVEKDWRKVGGRWYYMGENGPMKTGWFKEFGKNTWYYANGSGAMQTGWLYQGVWYYLDGSGAMAENAWRYLGGHWYYLGNNGPMKTGWFKETGKNTWYYANGSGAMQTGWLYQGVWYYLEPSGAMVENDWRKLGGRWYYLGNNGPMKTGWFKETGKDTWYYANASGAMQTGWVCPGGTWYYLEPSGAMKTGWLLLGNVWYYLKPVSGAMAVGYVKIDGKTERFDGNGHYRPGLDRMTLVTAINGATGARGFSVSGASLPANVIAKLNADISAIQAGGGTCGVVLVDLTSGAVISSNAWQGYYAASSIKGSYVCAISASDPGKASAYRGTIANTISWSSNDDYKRLRSAFGGAPMATYMNQAGVSSFSPYSTWVDMSAADQAKLWVRNYDYMSEASGASAWVEGYYRNTSMSFINQALGASYNVYSKAGWIWNGRGSRYHVYDDGGFVEKGDKPYVIAVMSSANSTDQGKLAQLVRDLDSAHSQLVRK